MLVCGYIRIYLTVYGPDIIGGFGLEEKSQKTKAVCGLGRTNYGGLWNVRPPIIDSHLCFSRSVSAGFQSQCSGIESKHTAPHITNNRDKYAAIFQ